MTGAVQIGAVGVAAALCALVLKKHTPELAFALALAAGCVLLSLALGWMEQLTAFLNELGETAVLSPAVLAPVLFVWFGSSADISFIAEFRLIAIKVVPMIVFPLGLAWALYFTAPRVHAVVADGQKITFYLWSVSLLLVVGKSVSFVLQEPAEAIPQMIAMAIGAGVVCVLQFYIGRRIGARYDQRVSAAQGLGQKNTVLAVWMAVNYLNPISSIGPAAYIAWQNSINSLQLYLKMKRERRTNAV